MLLVMDVKLKDLYKGNGQIWKAQYYVSLVIFLYIKNPTILIVAELAPCQSSSSTWFCLLQTGLEKGIHFAVLQQNTSLMFGLKNMLFFKFKYLCYMVIVVLLCPTVHLCYWSAVSSMIPLDLQAPG